jgi:putative tryptophan/tyrosine transport system substrate-binding protein
VSPKWLELLKQIAPSVTRAAVLHDPTITAGAGQFAADDIEHAVTAFGQTANGGLIVTASGSAAVHRKLIIGLAARHKLPNVYLLPTTLCHRRRPNLLQCRFH